MKIKNLILLIIVAFGLVYCDSKNDITNYIETGNVEEIKKILAKYFDPTDTIGNRTYFQYAIYEGQVDIFEAFFEHSGSRLEDYQVQDLLFLSIKVKQRKIFDYLSKETLYEDSRSLVAHALDLLEEVGWTDEYERLMLLNNDVHIFYDFIEKHKDNEKYEALMLKLFKRHWPVSEVYIGSKYDGYSDEDEYDEYEGERGEAYEDPESFDEPLAEYEQGSFNTLMKVAEDKYLGLDIHYFTVFYEEKKALLSFEQDENKMFNNFYKRVFEDNNFDRYGDSQDIRARYTGTITKRLPYYLPKFSRFSHPYTEESEFRQMHNSNNQLFAYLFHRLDRNSVILEWMWKAWKETVFKNIPLKTYFGKSFYDYTEGLIQTYDTITSRDNYIELLAEGYHNLAVNKNDNIYDCIPETVRYEENSWRVDWTWTSGFWARRFHEGNQELIYKILKEISAHYAGADLKELVKKRLEKEISEATYLRDYKRLVEEGANADLLVGKNGITKLHVAVLKNNLSDIKKLIKNGEDVNVRDDKKYTPLYYAGSLEAVKLLVENGALVNDSISQYKPIEYFKSNGETAISDFLKKYK